MRSRARREDRLKPHDEDNETFSGTPEELEALLRDSKPPGPRKRRQAWPLGIRLLIVAALALAAWAIPLWLLS